MEEQTRKVLLLGNGINRIDNDYSWEQLMADLLDFAKLGDAISVRGKPFPLLYEELYLRWMAIKPEKGEPERREHGLKNEIKSLLRNIRYSDLHKQVMDLPVEEILTTNYDYNLESALPSGVKGCPPIPPVKGSKYSMHRKRQAGNKVIWHIHGEVYAPGTILLGYEQYAGYLQNIRNYMVNGIKYTHFELPALNRRLWEGNLEIRSWVDHFFLSDLYILGLSMDFVEMHLWWILDYRARLKMDSRYNIHNKIVFIYPSAHQKWIKSRIDLLCACGVECMQAPVENHDWKSMYRNTLEFVGQS